MKTIFCGLVLLASGVNQATAQQRLTSNVAHDPAEAEFIYDDIESFLSARVAITGGMDSTVALRTLYFDRASPGLLMFIDKYDLTVERLLTAMEKYPQAYARIGQTLEALREREASFAGVYEAIQHVIPAAVFPPTWFVVAGHRGIGSGSIEGPLISIEKNTPESVRDGDIEPTLVHEMIHMEQLAAVGEAYFDIFSGDEQKLWRMFSEDMFGHEMGDWLWEKPARPEQPQDLGYVIGGRIVETYYKNAADPGRAAMDIMSITDYPGFLAQSGYPEEAPGRAVH